MVNGPCGTVLILRTAHNGESHSPCLTLGNTQLLFGCYKANAIRPYNENY